MAYQDMGVETAAVLDGVEILYNSEYVGQAITLDEAAFTSGVCKAGTPMTASGAKAEDATSVAGILLHDVYDKRPQGTVVIGGYINTDVAQTHSGVTLSDVTKAALKNVVFI